MKQQMDPAYYLKNLLIFFSCTFLIVADLPAQVLTLPVDQRPEWLRKEGLVMAGSWEPLTYRTRQGTLNGHVPTAEERALWEKEHSPEVTQKMKDLGVNFIMMHCYKGAGLNVEKETMQDAVRFARQYRAAGLHVGVYAFSGAFLWEPMYREDRGAQNWALLDENHKPFDYYNLGIRYYWNRNDTSAQAFYKKIVDFAVNDIKADLLHFDNYSRGPGTDLNSTRRFREYLRNTFTSEELEQMGASDLSLVFPQKENELKTPLQYAWMRFKSNSLAQSYKEMGQYARSMRKDVLLELNCGGPGNRIRWIDHGQQFQGGEAFWSEGGPSGFSNGKFNTRIVSYKIARSLDNMIFYYANTRLSMAESMAFNTDCLGMVCGFENGEIVSPGPEKHHKIEEVIPYIKFYKTRRELFADANVTADVAVLRSYPSQVFSDDNNAGLTSTVEQYCVNNRVPFQIIHDTQLSDLKGFRVLALAGCVSLSDAQVQQILKFVNEGGRLCVIGPVATSNEWMVPRKLDVFADVPKAQIVRSEPDDDIGNALLQSAGGKFSFDVAGPEGLYTEYASTPGHQLVHLVNFRPELAIENVAVTMQIPDGKKARQVFIASPDQKGDVSIRFTRNGNEIAFTVPRVDTYSIAVVKFQ